MEAAVRGNGQRMKTPLERTLCKPSHFSRVQLCDPMGCSPPGSSVHRDSPGKNTGAGCHYLLQGILPTQVSSSHFSLGPWLTALTSEGSWRRFLKLMSEAGCLQRLEFLISFALSPPPLPPSLPPMIISFQGACRALRALPLKFRAQKLLFGNQHKFSKY